MTNLPDEDDSAYPKCPHCGGIHICKHVALAVDLTFRDAFGGYLENNISKMIKKTNEEESSDSNNFAKEFDEYINQLRASGNFIEANYSDSHGPGFSSAYATFYKKIVNF